jgi:hypothetical protein
MGYQKKTYVILISKMNSFISRRVLLQEMELDFTKMFRETESLYLIVDFEIGASHFKFILSFLLRNEGKYGLQAENHKTRILQCSCHGVRLPTAMQKKENLNWAVGQSKATTETNKTRISHTKEVCFTKTQLHHVWKITHVSWTIKSMYPAGKHNHHLHTYRAYNA